MYLLPSPLSRYLFSPTSSPVCTVLHLTHQTASQLRPPLLLLLNCRTVCRCRPTFFQLCFSFDTRHRASSRLRSLSIARHSSPFVTETPTAAHRRSRAFCHSTVANLHHNRCDLDWKSHHHLHQVASRHTNAPVHFVILVVAFLLVKSAHLLAFFTRACVDRGYPLAFTTSHLRASIATLRTTGAPLPSCCHNQINCQS